MSNKNRYKQPFKMKKKPKKKVYRSIFKKDKENEKYFNQAKNKCFELLKQFEAKAKKCDFDQDKIVIIYENLEAEYQEWLKTNKFNLENGIITSLFTGYVDSYTREVNKYMREQEAAKKV